MRCAWAGGGGYRNWLHLRAGWTHQSAGGYLRDLTRKAERGEFGHADGDGIVEGEGRGRGPSCHLATRLPMVGPRDGAAAAALSTPSAGAQIFKQYRIQPCRFSIFAI